MGELVRHTLLADGRYQIVLGGIARVALEEIPRSTPWRQARISVLDDAFPVNAAELENRMRSLVGLAMGLREPSPSAFKLISGLLEQSDDPCVITNCLASCLWSDPAERQSLLTEVDVLRRLERVVDRLAQILAEVSGTLDAEPS